VLAAGTAAIRDRLSPDAPADRRHVPVRVHHREFLLRWFPPRGNNQQLGSPQTASAGRGYCLTPRPPRNPDTSANVGAYAPTCSQATAAAPAANAAWSSSLASGRVITLNIQPAMLASPAPTVSSTRTGKAGCTTRRSGVTSSKPA